MINHQKEHLMESYKHKVNYYETDKMGITHHSNYIRFMEEARVYFLEQIGWGYDKFEEKGIIEEESCFEEKGIVEEESR